MRRPGLFFIAVIFLLVLYFYRDDLSTYFYSKYIESRVLEIKNPNQYATMSAYSYAKTTDDFTPEDSQDILNILYTIIDSGIPEFTFYCPVEYEDCVTEVENIITDNQAPAVINNYVHPFNSYNNLSVSFNELGRITVKIDKLYSEEEIRYINNTVDQISSSIINDNMTIREKIKAFHNYIINYTTYDTERSNEIKNNIANQTNLSHKATGLLKDKIAICGGYTDTMAIFLSRLGIPNIKISTEDHIWNLVFLNNNWYHLDLTWDDTGAPDGEIIDVFFLITTKQLESLNTLKHIYNKDIYKEAN